MVKGIVLKRVGEGKYINILKPRDKPVPKRIWEPIIKAFKTWGSIGGGISGGKINIQKGTYTIIQRTGLSIRQAENAYKEFIFAMMKAATEGLEIPNSRDYFGLGPEEEE